jgi:phospholipase/carboxylesterase
MIDAYPHIWREGRTGAPLFVVFHGTGGNERQFPDLAADLLPGAHVLSPRGDVDERGAHRFFRRRAEGVYDMNDLARATTKMTGFVRAHRDRVQAGRVVGLGYSNGANILAAVSFAAPGLFTDLVLMHPLIPFAPEVHPGHDATRVLLTAGQRDPICPAPLTEALAAWYAGQGAAVSTWWHEGGHEVPPSEIAAIETYMAPLRTGPTA